MAGIVVTAQDIQGAAGNIAKKLVGVASDIATFKLYLDGKSVDDLVAAGLTSQDATLIKSAYTDAAQLMAIAQGHATLAEAKNFMVFIRQLWGLGAL